MFTGPKPFVVVDLLGPGGNIFAIIARCERITRAGPASRNMSSMRSGVQLPRRTAMPMRSRRFETWFDTIFIGRNPSDAGEKEA